MPRPFSRTHKFRVDLKGHDYGDSGYRSTGAAFAESVAVRGSRSGYEPGRTGFAVFQAPTLPDLIPAVHNNCDAENTLLGRLRMLACNRLRIDPGNGSPAVDYRIESGFVESRTLEPDAAKRSSPAIDKQWQRLTPEQLTSRVMADAVVAQWLRHRMGLHRLIQACNQESSYPINPDLNSSSRTAA